MNESPLAIDLFCGLGGWTDGLLAEGYRVIGFDIEAHDYGDGHRYPEQLVIQDVLTLHGRQFKEAVLLVASPPCQTFSWMAMPWSKAKAVAADYRSGKRDMKKLTALFDACFRIQREAIEAAGHFIPMVVENVRGAQPWVGSANWNFGSYYLWGDVPALMPITSKWSVMKRGITRRPNGETNFHGMKLPGNNSPRRWDEREVQRLCDAGKAEGFKTSGMNLSDRSLKGQDFTRIAGQKAEAVKVASEEGRRTYIGKGARFTSRDCGMEAEGVKGFTPSGEPIGKNVYGRTGSKSNARKAASAKIARIPFSLAQWIARVYKPKVAEETLCSAS